MIDSITRGDVEHEVERGTEQTAAPRGHPRGALSSLWQRKGSFVGLIGLLLILGAALFAPALAPHDPLEQTLSKALLPPMWVERGEATYPLGTDALGRDLMSRIIYGTRYSLLISVAAALIGSGLGLLVGLVSGFSSRRVDALFMRLGDIQLAFPFILLAIAILGVSPNRSPLHLILVLGIPSWIIYGRVVRSRVLAEREKEYAVAAKALGASGSRRLFRYILPNVWQVIPVIVMLDIGFLVIMESMLSFLGFGLTPPTPSWGSILADGKQFMMVSPWMPILPGLAIVFTVLSINLIADGLADLFDPKLASGMFRHARRRSAQQESGLGKGAQGGAPDRVPTVASSGAPLLEVKDLAVEFITPERRVRAVRGVSFALDRGQALGIVGESGSGKSVTALSILQLLDLPGRVTAGAVLFDGTDLTRLDEASMAALRGKRIGMIFQNPTASLNPVLTIGAQMAETLRRHLGIATGAADERARRALLEVGIGDPNRILKSYPFQLSGGMNQRVMIALVMSLQPDLLIADEPTTALDVTTQAQILERLQAIIREQNTSMILITHDIALLAGFVDRIVVMYAGLVCESGPARAVVDAPSHPYTQALLNSVPRADVAEETQLPAIPGDPPDPTATYAGCPFAARCPSVMEICRSVYPPRSVVAADHETACHLYAGSPDPVRTDSGVAQIAGDV